MQKNPKENVGLCILKTLTNYISQRIKLHFMTEYLDEQKAKLKNVRPVLNKEMTLLVLELVGFFLEQRILR